MTEARAMARSRKRESREISSLRTPAQVRLQTMINVERAIIRGEDHVALLTCTLSFQNHAWRERVAQWCYDVVDHLDVPRDVVYLAMNILDRYLATSPDACSVDKLQYELAANTSLFLAVRSSGSMDLKIPDLLQLSRSNIQVRDVLATGTRILETLTWDQRILAPSIFVGALIGLLQSSIDASTAVSVLELASYLVEISVCDQQFCRVPPSKVAFASLLIAMDNQSCNIDPKTLTAFLYKVHQETGMSSAAADIKLICSHLRSTYSQSQDSCHINSPHVIIDVDESNPVNTESSRDVEPYVMSARSVSSDLSDLRPVSPLWGSSNKRLRLN